MQSGHEKTITSMLPSLAGASNVYGAGMLELGMSFSKEQLVVDNDIIGMIKYARRGIDVNEKTLSYDAIRDVGIGNDFLGYPDTLANFGLPSHPEVFDRNMIGEWEKMGSLEAIDVAHNRVDEILRDHHPEPIDSDARKEIDRIIAEADRRVVQQSS